MDQALYVSRNERNGAIEISIGVKEIVREGRQRKCNQRRERGRDKERDREIKRKRDKLRWVEIDIDK